MRRHGHGFIVGKFYPPHSGHHHLIATAAEQCDRLTVLVCAAHVETIPLADRLAWLRETHAGQPRVRFLGTRCDLPMDVGSDAVWAAQVALMQAALKQHGAPAVDAVFTSEAYGDELARRLGAVHVCVDPGRTTRPVSGSACRADLPGLWDELAPATRRGLATRVVVNRPGSCRGSAAWNDIRLETGGVVPWQTAGIRRRGGTRRS